MGQLRLLGEPPASDDHAALANLAFPQAGHTGFVAAAGLAGGQTIIGGIAPGENLSLQSTAHAARGVVQVIDALRLVSGLIQDSGGNARIALATASPHLTLTGDLQVTQHGAFGASAAIDAGKVLSIYETLATHPANALYTLVYGNRAAGPQFTYGIYGAAIARGTPSTAMVYGLSFYASHDTPSPCTQLGAITVRQESGASGTGAITIARGLYIPAATWLGSKPGIVCGVDIEQQGGSGTGTAYGLRIADQTANTVRLLELGPATPYLRLVGGGAPGANQTNLYLNEGGTLRRVQWVDPGAGGANLQAGQRVLILA